MDIFVSGNRITVSEEVVNHFKSNPENCPLCGGTLWKADEKTGKRIGQKCEMSHPQSLYIEQQKQNESWFLKQFCVPYSEDDPYRHLSVYVQKADGVLYRQLNNKRIEKLNRLEAKINELKSKLCVPV